ncbi:hypothetical protein PAXINDRAFT_101299 [Paxillus involutus ATCC 200175]|uniref:Uncharacterized protein n=1 Tax=Paxillus involutus ATCC 200175 TaxID=664439 RepID=A0A0C9STT0_PAXIN|nr:hypothetical protein PAXINDRAFT_101299 [Paxillus involutus ATCC 200175]
MPLLPNLRRLKYDLIINNLHLDVGSATYVASLFTLFSPNLLQEYHDRHRFLMYLPKCCPQIKALGVLFLEIAEYLAVFASFQHLKSLSLAAVSGFAMDFSSFMNPLHSFPSIVNLIVECCSANMVLQIFKAIHSTQLRDIDLNFCTDIDITDLREVLAIVASRPAWKQFLHLISIAPKNVSSMTNNDVRGLLTLNHLRDLRLDGTGLVLDDCLLDSMAKAWPMLERLSITDLGSGIPSNATLNGLVPFFKHCPHLETLELRLDAREVPASSNAAHASRDESREGDRTDVLLGVDGDSEIRDPIGVASFLLNLFPRITLSIVVLDPDDYDEEDFELWGRVVDIIEGAPEVNPPPAISWNP